MNIVDPFQEKINNAKELDFGTIFSASIELFKKTWLQGFLLQVFTIIVMLPLIIILYIPLFTLIFAQAQSGNSDSYVWSEIFAGMSILYVFFIIIGVLVLGAVSVALNAAFYRIMKRLDHDEKVITSDFFYFLNVKYLRKAFVLMLVSILIAIPSALLCFIPLIYMIVPLSFFAIIFAFNPELTVSDIVKTSFRIGHKKWLLAFGLIFVSGLLAEIVGFLLCGIGMLFTAAFVYHPVYLIYKNVIGFDSEYVTNNAIEEEE
jgi:hypothetical protein